MAVAVKRVYESAARVDGARVLVDRLWPRGLKKEDAGVKLWLRDLAPSTELRQWFHANPNSWRMFRKRYLKELANAKGSAAMEKLQRLAAAKRRVTLLYGSRNDQHNNAVVLKEVLDGARKPPSSVGPGASGKARIRKAKPR